MKLFLVQHAKAASKEIDPDRPLTEEGLRDIQGICEFIKSLNLSVDYLWHSGKTRARQTAEILAEVITVANGIAAHDGLAPNDDVRVIKDQIVSAQNDIMIVGHMPFVAKLASLLLIGSESTQTIAFMQGGVVCLNCTDECKWQLEWMIIPVFFQAL